MQYLQNALEGEPFLMPILEGGFQAWLKQILHQNTEKEDIFYRLQRGIVLSLVQDNFGFQNKDCQEKQVWLLQLELLYMGP